MTQKPLPHDVYVSKRVGKASVEYDMLNDNDLILVAVSGGKDSMALLELLRLRRNFIPIDYTIEAAFIDAGIPDFPLDDLKAFFEREKIPFHVKRAEALCEKDWSEIDCFTCSRIRRKLLFETANELGIKKIAMGHHLDDIAETIMMNLIFRGEIGAMCPKQDFFDGELSIIRPLAYLQKSEIEKFVEEQNIYFCPKNQCPNSDETKRIMIRNLLNDLEKENHQAKKNILNGLRNIRTDYLL